MPTLSDSELADIAARAAPLFGRPRPAQAAGDGHIRSEQTQKRMMRWADTSAGGVPERFQSRLARLGLDAAGAQAWLESPPAPASDAPSWTAVLRTAIETAGMHASDIGKFIADRKSRGVIRDTPVAFEEIILPFIDAGRALLRTRASDDCDLLAPSVIVQLERRLLQRLSRIAVQALTAKFTAYRSSRQTGFELLLQRLQQHTQDRLYKEFVEAFYNGGLKDFLVEYCVLGRLLGTAVEQWVGLIGEFLTHLRDDQEAIARTFGSPRPDALRSGAIVSDIGIGLSDPHCGGRTVLLVRFSSGLRLVYKPKGLSLENAYFRLLDWLNRKGLPYPLKTLAILDRADHGWVEFAAHIGCDKEEEATRFFVRSGMLLCLLHVLGTTDCHMENVIACGEHPVLVDVETIMHPRVKLADEDAAAGQAEELIMNSVLRTGLLPHWEFDAKGNHLDLSGLGAVQGQVLPFDQTRLHHANTDAMEFVVEENTTQAEGNIASLSGRPLSAADHAEDIESGFRLMYDFLLARRQELLDTDNGPLKDLKSQRVRYLFRATKVYSVMLDRTLAPRYLRDGVDRSIELEALARAMSGRAAHEIFWPLVQYEQAALEQLDIPYFTAPAHGDSLPLGEADSIPCFREAGFDGVLTRLRGLCSEDLEYQLTIARTLLHARRAAAHATDDVTAPESDAVRLHGDEPEDPFSISPEALVARAEAIAAQLMERAIHGKDGSVTWLTLAYHPISGRQRLEPMGINLYDGSMGVALFFAALFNITGNEAYRACAMRIIKPVRERIDGPHAGKTLRKIGLGGALGLGSVLYGMTKIARLIDAPELHAEAARAACRIDDSLIGADHHYDVTAGAAGAILGLTTLFTATRDASVLEKATQCARHLLAKRVELSTGFRTWLTLDRKPLTGFSHGAAGIAYALLRLHALTDEAVWRNAAQEAIEYEQSLYVPDANNWPDLLQAEQPAFRTSWCHGAPGIGLARLGGLAFAQSPEVDTDIRLAIDKTLRSSPAAVHHLCCGNLGRIELLLTACIKLGLPELRSEIGSRLRNIIGAVGVGRNDIAPHRILHPGLFQGHSGIGYQLLRLADPSRISSVLLWE